MSKVIVMHDLRTLVWFASHDRIWFEISYDKMGNGYRKSVPFPYSICLKHPITSISFRWCIDATKVNESPQRTLYPQAESFCCLEWCLKSFCMCNLVYQPKRFAVTWSTEILWSKYELHTGFMFWLHLMCGPKQERTWIVQMFYHQKEVSSNIVLH